MEKFDGPLFDCDNHYYEAEDAFMRHVPRKMQKRCVQWVDAPGRLTLARATVERFLEDRGAHAEDRVRDAGSAGGPIGV